ncbi:MAG: DUF523 domain-containing protein [Clostridia bacterium]|nr:DUF523 domain-containing protein [Clostridia bacterium]
MKKIIVSACLLGERCRFDGESKPNDDVLALKNKFELIPVCAEVFGGLSVPRLPAEIVGGKVIRADGFDVTDNYRIGAEKVLKIAIENRCELAILKARSPSCGKGRIYDGSFTKKLIVGNGICAQLLIDNGIKIVDETEVGCLIYEDNSK